ncbi:MAG TPA: hypothetical protein VHO26_13620 [Propionibacteriaceae bacterium]|nr:hypothetical protein [Propionibacteriaceae bacterium]
MRNAARARASALPDPPGLWFFCIDDEGWVTAFRTARELRGFLEPGHEEETRVVMDSSGMQYQLAHDGLQAVRRLSAEEMVAHMSTTEGFHTESVDDVDRWFSWHATWSVVIT